MQGEKGAFKFWLHLSIDSFGPNIEHDASEH